MYDSLFQNCIAYYPGVKIGTSYVDVIGRFNGTINGTVPMDVIDRFGMKYTLNWEYQSTSNYVSAPFTDKLSSTSQTIIAAMRPRALYSTNPCALALHNSTGGYYGWDLRIGTDRINFMLNSTAGGNTKSLDYSTTNPDWDIFTISFTPSSIKLYRNGLLIASNTDAGTYVSTSTMYLNFGVDMPGQYYPFMGEIGEVMIFTVELTAVQIKAINDVMKMHYVNPKKGYWK